MSRTSSPLKKPASRALAIDAIRTAMVEKKLTQAELADIADCHEKTVQNLMGGRSVRDQTLFDVCMVLDLEYPTIRHAWHGLDEDDHGAGIQADRAANEPADLKASGGVVAPVYMGAYTEAAVDHYIGSYLTIRRAFSKPKTIVVYRTDITWDPEWPSLLFSERDRPDTPYAHRGRLYIPASSMFIHLVSLTKGAMRMIVVSQLDRAGEMRGLITTLNKDRANFVPVATPIIYAQRKTFDDVTFGEISEGQPDFARLDGLLRSTISEGYARLVE